MVLGFLLAAYSVVGNDVIQTLGTFLSSNKDKKWWVLWLYTGTILSAVLVYGWYSYNGDVSYGRLNKVGELPQPFEWWYVLPPLVLMLITRVGIPVSTTFLIISVFKIKLIESMLIKSAMGYLVAFIGAIVIYFLISKAIEKKFLNKPALESNKNLWTVFQWLSTGFLWSMWLIQDLSNIYVYLPRNLSYVGLLLSLVVILGLQAYIFYNKGGKIQKIVNEKTNTHDIRSATIIDFIYGLILFFFKELSSIPMSTTWVFIGLLAGRELALNQALKIKSLQSVVKMTVKDLGKVTLGLVVSVGLVFLIRLLQ